MRELPNIIPDISTVLALEPEELGAKILFLLRKRGGRVQRAGLENEPFDDVGSNRPSYPGTYRHQFAIALTEAWAWLEAQGLLIPDLGANGENGFRILSRRAGRFESESDLSRYTAARRLPRESLHPSISETVWSAFIRGEYDVAVFQAMKAVEVAVRDAAELPSTEIGMRLMRNAFNPKGGKLADMTADEGEREALSSLFAGAIGSYKNPQSHRHVPLDDPAEAIEIVLLANHLLRIVEARSPAGAT